MYNSGMVEIGLYYVDSFNSSVLYDKVYDII